MGVGKLPPDTSLTRWAPLVNQPSHPLSLSPLTHAARLLRHVLQTDVVFWFRCEALKNKEEIMYRCSHTSRFECAAAVNSRQLTGCLPDARTVTYSDRRCVIPEIPIMIILYGAFQMSPATQQMQPTQTLQSPPTSGGRRRRVVDEDPDERRRKFLERNRAAATRCRQKRKVWVMSLEKKAEELTQTNMQLQVQR